MLIGIIALSAICTAFSWISSWLALILGMTFTLFLGIPYEGRIENFTSTLLKISVVAIGFGYPLSAITELSASSFSSKASLPSSRRATMVFGFCS